jgi:hypothetical protein
MQRWTSHSQANCPARSESGKLPIPPPTYLLTTKFSLIKRPKKRKFKFDLIHVKFSSLTLIAFPAELEKKDNPTV